MVSPKPGVTILLCKFAGKINLSGLVFSQLLSEKARMLRLLPVES